MAKKKNKGRNSNKGRRSQATRSHKKGKRSGPPGAMMGVMVVGLLVVMGIVLLQPGNTPKPPSSSNSKSTTAAKAPEPKAQPKPATKTPPPAAKTDGLGPMWTDYVQGLFGDDTQKKDDFQAALRLHETGNGRASMPKFQSLISQGEGKWREPVDLLMASSQGLAGAHQDALEGIKTWRSSHKKSPLAPWADAFEARTLRMRAKARSTNGQPSPEGAADLRAAMVAAKAAQKGGGPASSFAAYERARILKAQKKPDEALKAYQEVVDRYPKSAEAPKALSSLYTQQRQAGQIPEAIRTAERLVSEFPSASQVKRARGDLTRMKTVGTDAVDWRKVKDWIGTKPPSVSEMGDKGVFLFFLESW